MKDKILTQIRLCLYVLLNVMGDSIASWPDLKKDEKINSECTNLFTMYIKLSRPWCKNIQDQSTGELYFQFNFIKKTA